MAQLNNNGKLAFLRHCLELNPTNEHAFIDFARKLIVSNAYLECSRTEQIYLLFIQAEETAILFGSFGNKTTLYARPAFDLPDTAIQKLLRILNPPMIFFRDIHDVLPDDLSSPTRFSNLLVHTTAKIALQLEGVNQGRYTNFIAQHSSRITRLRCDSHLLLDERIPVLKLNSLDLAGPKNMEELRAIMRHQSKRLKFTRYYHEGILLLDNNFLQEILVMTDIDSYPMSSFVKSLTTAIEFVDNAHTRQVIEALKKLFPCVETFALRVELLEEVDEPLDPMTLAQRVRDYYNVTKQIAEDYHDKFKRFSIGFDFHLHFERRAYLDGIWIYELQKDGPFKSGEVDHYGMSPGNFDRWHSLTVQHSVLAAWLQFGVLTSMNFANDSDDSDQEMEFDDE